MEKLFGFLPKRTMTLVLILFVSVLFLYAISFFRNNEKPPPNPVIFFRPSPSPVDSIQANLVNRNKISVLQKSEIGKTTSEEVEKKYETLKKQALEDGSTRYAIASPLDARPNEIVLRNNRAVFERTILLTDDPGFKYPKSSELIQQLGQPNKIIQGSSFYGYNVKTYIYPNLGLAFIAEEGSENVFEVQTFIPLSFDEYMQKYGGDIVEGDKPVEHPL